MYVLNNKGSFELITKSRRFEKNKEVKILHEFKKLIIIEKKVLP